MYEAVRRVRLGDVDPTGRCRLDALARFAQDVARDDSADAALRDPMGWVVRRVMLEVHQAPRLRESLELATWCSGYGRRWAERRTTLRGHRGAHVESVTIWVCVDAEGRPMRLGSGFFEVYGPSAAERIVSSRKSLPVAPAADARSLPWALRHADFDVLGHVNNAAQWQAVEEAMALAGVPRPPLRAEIEHGAPMSEGDTVELRWTAGGDVLDCWLTADAKTAAAARVTRL